jgi:hypothetical protein
VALLFAGKDPAQITHVAAAVHGRIAIENFRPTAGAGQANAILKARHWRQVQNYGKGIFIPATLSDE